MNKKAKAEVKKVVEVIDSGYVDGTRTNVGQTNVGEDKRRTDKRRTDRDKRRIRQT